MCPPRTRPQTFVYNTPGGPLRWWPGQERPMSRKASGGKKKVVEPPAEGVRFTVTNPDVEFDDDQLQMLVDFLLHFHAKRMGAAQGDPPADVPTADSPK